MRQLYVSLLLVVMGLAVQAEEQRVVVVLDDGTRIEGLLIEYGSRVYRFRIGAQVVEIPEEKVQEIQFQRGPSAGTPERPARPRGDQVRPVDGSNATGAAIQASLLWMARHQHADGGWSAGRFAERCVGGACAGKGDEFSEAGCTALAVLAFLEAGELPASATQVTDPLDPSRVYRYGEVVRNGLVRLVKSQKPDGGFTSAETFKRMRDDALATMAMARAFGLTSATEWEEPARKAVGYVCAARNPGAVWRFMPRCGDNDSLITGWCATALQVAEDAGIEVDPQAWPAVRTWYDTVTDPESGKVGYVSREDAGMKVVTVGSISNEDFQNHETYTAIGMVYRRIGLADAAGDENVARGRSLLAQDLPRWNKTAKSNDYGYWYWGTRALFPSGRSPQGGNDTSWTAWAEAAADALVGHQARDGCAAGSWDADDRWGFEGGRVWATALNAMTLDLCHRDPNAAAGTGSERK